MIDIEINPVHLLMVIGQRGSGKTTWVKNFAMRMQASYPTIIYDTLHEYDPNQFSVYRPKIADNILEFEYICKLIQKKGRIHFIVEEADNFCSPWKITSTFRQLCSTGRHQGIGLTLVTRRVQDMAKLPCANAHHWIIYLTYLPGDKDYLRKFVGTLAEKAADLPPYNYIYFRPGAEKISRVCPPVSLL